MGHCVERDEDQGFSIKTIVERELSYTREQRRKNMRSAERQKGRAAKKEARGTKPMEESREVTLEDTVKHRRRLS